MNTISLYNVGGKINEEKNYPVENNYFGYTRVFVFF
jgi:hypothetical protein